MTLDTRIVAITPCDAHDVFHYCRELLNATDQHPFKDRDASKYYGEGVWSIGNDAGIGLAALLDIKYRPGLEPLRTPEQAAAHDEYCDDDCTGAYHGQACWVEISFDTAYGYRGTNGEGCGELHARLVFELGEWFDERKIGWGWQNEFTGEWHWEDKYNALKDLITDGGQAMAWFTETVMPTIEAMGGRLIR